MTNPAQALRMMLTYLVVIPLAIVIGYLLTNPLDYGTMGFVGIVLVLLFSPIAIKWHYQLLIFGLACPATCFFLPGKPPLAQAVVIMSLGIAIVERTLSSQRRFISPLVVVWPLLYLVGMVYMTAYLTGGIGFNVFGGGTGGGRKYLNVFLGIATFFALTSRAIPRDRWKFYLGLSMLPSILGSLGDFFTVLPGPFQYLCLLFPPTGASMEIGELGFGSARLTMISHAVGVVPIYLLARYGIRGIFLEGRLVIMVLFVVTFTLQLMGGYRSMLVGFGLTFVLMFFLEGLHRTRFLPMVLMFGILAAATGAVFSDKLPNSIQRSMSFLPLKWKSEVLLDAQSSSEWRYNIWRATWPKVPEYLLLGKGYTLTKEDMDMIGEGQFANIKASHIDASEETLAISNDFHSGPLSTLLCFGIWGAIGILWLMGATLFVTYRNYRYGDNTLRTYNVFVFVGCMVSIFSFLFIFGGFDGDVGNFAKMAGFSIAMNGGVAKKPGQSRVNPLIKSPAGNVPQPA